MVLPEAVLVVGVEDVHRAQRLVGLDRGSVSVAMLKEAVSPWRSISSNGSIAPGWQPMPRANGNGATGKPGQNGVDLGC